MMLQAVSSCRICMSFLFIRTPMCMETGAVALAVIVVLDETSSLWEMRSSVIRLMSCPLLVVTDRITSFCGSSVVACRLYTLFSRCLGSCLSAENYVRTDQRSGNFHHNKAVSVENNGKLSGSLEQCHS